MNTSTEETQTFKLLIIDDDETFSRVLARAMSHRGFECFQAQNIHSALVLARQEQPSYCVLDLKLGDESGLRLIPQLLAEVPELRILLLTGYASIATAVEAIKRGAYDYLAKPVDANQVASALLDTPTEREGNEPPLLETPPPLKRLEWEHIQRVLSDTSGNISEAARRLGMHRRTLQRKLSKRPVKERPRVDKD